MGQMVIWTWFTWSHMNTVVHLLNGIQHMPDLCCCWGTMERQKLPTHTTPASIPFTGSAVKVCGEKTKLPLCVFILTPSFDDQWQDAKNTPKCLSVIPKLSFWKSIVLVVRGKVWSSREMSCELKLQWKLILSVSLCSIFWGKQSRAEKEPRSPIKWDAEVPGATTGLAGPSGQSCNCQTSLPATCWSWQKESSTKKAAGTVRGFSKKYLARLQAWQAVLSSGRTASSFMNW